MAVRSLDEVKAAVDHLAGTIHPPEDLLPTYGVSRDLGYPHIEIDGILMSYVTVERGREIERHCNIDLVGRSSKRPERPLIVYRPTNRPTRRARALAL